MGKKRILFHSNLILHERNCRASKEKTPKFDYSNVTQAAWYIAEEIPFIFHVFFMAYVDQSYIFDVDPYHQYKGQRGQTKPFLPSL